MADVLQFRRGTQAENDAFTGAAGELSIDTTNWKLRIHDNSTAGGFTLARDDEKADTSHTHTLSDVTDSGTAAAEDTGTAAGELPKNEEIGAFLPSATDSGTDAFQANFSRDIGADEKVYADFGSANTTTTPTLENTGGAPAGAQTITTRDGSALWANALSGPHTLQLASDSGSWLVLDPLPIDEDDMASDSDSAVPTQQSVKAHFDAAEQQRAQAWVNFDGSGSVSIRDHYNVSSITDDGTGDYTVNFSTNLADANYAAVASSSGAGNFSSCSSLATSSVVVRNRDTSNTAQDDGIISVIVLGSN